MSVNSYFDSILSNIFDTLIIVDSNGDIKSVNKATLNLLEYSAEELIEQPLSKILGDEQLFFLLNGLMEGGSLREFELPYHTKHGREIPMSCTGSLVHDEQGKVAGTVWIAKDITERKQAEQALQESEERYRTLFENIPIGVYRVTPDGRILNANPALLKMLGFKSVEELAARNMDRDGFERGYSRREFREKIEKFGEIKGEQVVWKRKDGSLIYASENAKLIRNAAGESLYYEGTIEDISERKKIEEMKNEFVSIVSHELRVPLTSIRGALEWLVEHTSNELPPRAKRMIEIASHSSERMVRLINDMLDIDKIESGKVTFNLRALEIVPLLQLAIESNQTYAEQFGVRFQFEDNLGPAKANVDSDRFTQVVTNLLSNAVKFSPPNGTVTVSAGREDSMLRVKVRDEGSGIPEKYRSRIFQKFVQLGASEDRKKGGTGLGLSISKAIVEKLGGSIGFESETNHGTTFYFDLPECS